MRVAFDISLSNALVIKKAPALEKSLRSYD